MGCFSTEKLVDSFFAEYKAGLIGKKLRVFISIYQTYIEGNGFEINTNFGFDFNNIFDNETEFEIKIKDIKRMTEENIKGNSCLKIEYVNTDFVANINNTIIIPNLKNIGDIIEIVNKLKEREKERIEREKLQKQAKMLREKQAKEDCQKFFHDCYNFHILENGYPYFELHREEFQFACIYLDKIRNINFLLIDGYNKEETNAIISFDKVHYYEKAGNIHYTTDIAGGYTDFGGSITGATFSKKVTFLAGLLLGPMGMVGGALFTHKPAQIETSKISMNLSSEVKKIDDRNVILNYYSDIRQQYIDIELPADIYNFLQTYLPEKKYNIVLELEKQSAIKQYAVQIETGKYISTPEQAEKNIVSDPMDDFAQKMEKLKIMYDCGVLSDKEFAEEKKKILAML